MPIPSVITKDSICLGDDMPAFDIGEGGVLNSAGPDMFGIEFGLEILHLGFAECHHLVLTARQGFGLPSWAP